MTTAAKEPLIVDLDGTLTPADTLEECIIQLVKCSPRLLLRLPLWLLAGRAGFKEAIAPHTALDFERLPYREPLLAYIREERTRGRRIVLATAAHASIAEGVSRHLGLFDDVLATRERRNLKGAMKLEAIRACVGDDFVYAGDSRADLPIWSAASAAILVCVAPATAAVVRRNVPIEREFASEPAGLGDWLTALRVHQWLKNLLLFVPLLTAFSFLYVDKLAATAMAFIAFSLVASATYVVNDLWDLDSDRAHVRKRTRPFASARLPISGGLAAATSCLAAGFGVASAVSAVFLAWLVLYFVLTSAYSWVLKRYVLIDVLTLSLLYTLRILAGAAAIAVPTSTWLLAFSVFMFLSLALVKRCAELVSLQQSGAAATRGRDYRVTDLVVLWPLGVASAVAAVVVFGLYISTPETQARYATPRLLWLTGMILIYWLARLWVKTSRGEMHDDPTLYAVKDRGSRLTVIAMVVVMLIAHAVSLEFA